MKIIKRLSIAIYTLLFITVATRAIAKSPPADAGNGTLKGTVTDKADGTTMPGVTVSIPDLRIGTSTNSKGQYTLYHLYRKG